MKKLLTATLFLGLGLGISASAFAADYDEGSPCYKKCLDIRMQCANACRTKFHNDKSQAMYHCMHGCDPHFNNKCVIHCPGKDGKPVKKAEAVKTESKDYDETSPCYKKLLKERMHCANKCRVSYHNDKSQKMYHCMHQCDYPFNKKVTSCPTL